MSDAFPTKHLPTIPDHESSVRRMMADAHRQPYFPLHTLAEAQSYLDGAVIFEGDWGGQIYATCPAALVRCSEATLDLLLRDFDALGWCDLEGARVFYERRAVGRGVGGGMGGGRMIADVWVHRTLAALNLTTAIREVLTGIRRPEPSIYFDLPAWDETSIDGFSFGRIKDSRTNNDGYTWGNGFVVAPDGSRAGLCWHVTESVEAFAARKHARESERRFHTDPEYFEQRRPFEAHRWGIWNIDFPYPMRIDDPLAIRSDARRNLEAALPKLKREWHRWRDQATTQEANRAKTDSSLRSE